MPTPDTKVTSGYGSPDYGFIMTGGLSSSKTYDRNPYEDFKKAQIRDFAPVVKLSDPSNYIVLYNKDGKDVYYADPSGRPINIGGGRVLELGPSKSNPRVIPALNPIEEATRETVEGVFSSFTGSDMRMFFSLSETSSLRYKLLVECSTLTVSVHREKAPVRSVGYIGAKAYARGRRTVAGTMVLIQFTTDVLYRFIQDVWQHDAFSKDDPYVKIDQLPPFDITILFTNEYGDASYRRLLGVDFLTDGTVYSVNDMLTEQTISYVASDFTPLMPLTRGALFDIRAVDKPIQNSVKEVLRKRSSSVNGAYPSTGIGPFGPEAIPAWYTK